MRCDDPDVELLTEQFGPEVVLAFKGLGRPDGPDGS
jgi:hypothetical protein